MSDLKMTRHLVLLKPIVSQMSDTIEIPSEWVRDKSHCLQGEIISVGPDCLLAKVGDVAYYAGGARSFVPNRQGKYLIIEDRDIIATREKK